MQQKMNKNSAKRGNYKRVHKKQWSKMIYLNLARKLFFELDGLSYYPMRRYSYRGISMAMLEKYGAKIHYSTICRWAHKYKWIEKWEHEVKNELMEAQEELERHKDLQKYSEKLKEIYKKVFSVNQLA
jgi:hypothetical protein